MPQSVLLLTRYQRKGPSSRVRHYNYLRLLERAGFHVTVAPLLDDRYIDRRFRGESPGLPLLMEAYWRRFRHLLSAHRYDLLWIEKEALPWLPARLERAFFRNRAFVIDFDDPWHLRYASHSNPLVRAVFGNKLETMVGHAKTVTVGSPALAVWAQSAAKKNVVEIPPSVDLARYPFQPFPDGPFTIGWIGTPPNEKYLELIAEPLRRLHATCGVRVRLIGGSGHFSLPGVEIDNIPWSEDTEAEELARCHVGVTPLLDGRWEWGKCGYKTIQYMAAGRPAVASAIGANKSIIVHEETGFLVQDSEEWISRLTELVANPVRLRAMGIAARRRAEAKYSLQHNAPKLIESLQNAIGMHCTGRSSPASEREETSDDRFVPELRQKIRARAG